jgi:hypothetical protein
MGMLLSSIYALKDLKSSKCVPHWQSKCVVCISQVLPFFFLKQKKVSERESKEALIAIHEMRRDYCLSRQKEKKKTRK